MNQRIQFTLFVAILVGFGVANPICFAIQTSAQQGKRTPDSAQATQELGVLDEPKDENLENTASQKRESFSNVIIEATIWCVRHSSKDLLTELQIALKDPVTQKSHAKIITELQKRNGAKHSQGTPDANAVDSHQMDREFVANLSSLERELLASMVSKIKGAQKLTSPSVITRDGRPASIFSGSAVPYRSGIGTGNQVVNFMDFGVKLEVLPRIKEADAIEIGFQFEQKKKLDEAAANALLNAQKDLQKLYSPIIAEDGKVKGEKLVFERPAQAPFLFEMARLKGQGSVPESKTLAIVASDSVSKGPKSSYLIFLTPSKIDEKEIGKLVRPNPAETNGSAPRGTAVMPQPTPVQKQIHVPNPHAAVPFYSNLAQQYPGKMADIKAGNPVVIPAPKHTDPVQISFDLPEGFRIDAGDLHVVDNALEIDRGFELLNLKVRGTLDGSAVYLDFCIWDQALDTVQAKVNLKLTLTDDQIRKIIKQKHLERFIWAPNISDLAQVSKEDKIYFQSFDVEDESDIKERAEQDGYETAALIVMFKDSNATIDDKLALAKSFPIGLIWKLLDHADTGQLLTRTLRVERRTGMSRGQVQVLNLYGAMSTTSHLHLIKPNCPVVFEEPGGHSEFEEVTILLSPRSALAFDQARQQGRVELFPRKTRDPEVTAANFVPADKSGSRNSIENESKDNAPLGWQMSNSPAQRASIVKELKSMRDDVTTLKSDVKRMIQMLEELK